MGEVLAIDIGSTAIKAGVFDVEGDLTGDVAHIRHRPAASTEPAGHLVPEALLDATVRAIRSLALNSVTVVATSTMWHANLAVDSGYDSIGPALSWEAAMPNELRRQLAAKLGSTWSHRDSGGYLHPSYSLVSMPVLAQRRPWRISDLGSWLVSRLAGFARAWPENIAAASGLWLQQRREWNLPALDALGVDQAQIGEQWVQPVRAASPLVDELRGAVFLPPVGDGLCHNIGQHAIDDRIAITVGTSGSVRSVTSVPPFDGPGKGLWRYRCAERTVATGGAITSAGNTFEWVASLFGSAIPWHTLTPELVEILPAADASVFGRRGPDYPWNAAGSITGITPGTHADHIALAWGLDVWRRFGDHLCALRSVTESEREIVVEGGAVFANPAAAQVLADVIDAPITCTRQGQPSLAGAALMGRTYNLNGEFNIDSTVAAIRAGTYVAPRSASTIFPRQRIAAALRERWRTLADGVSG